MKKLAIVLCLALTACGSALPSDGYGEVKYGMDEGDLTDLGFTCSKSECKKDDISVSENGPDFGKLSKITVRRNDGKVSQFDLTSNIYGTDEMIAVYSEAYGDPDICRFQNILGAKIEKYVWTAANGSSATISKILDYGINPDFSAATRTNSAITYRDADESAHFKSVSC